MSYFLVFIGCIQDLICVYTGLVAAQCGSQSFIGLILYASIAYAFLADLFIFDEEMNVKELLTAGVILVTTIGVSIYKIVTEDKRN